MLKQLIHYRVRLRRTWVALSVGALDVKQLIHVYMRT